MSRIARAALLLTASVCQTIVPTSATADFESAFPTPEEAARADERTVGVQLARDSRHFGLLDDVGASLGLAAGMRIAPTIAPDDVQGVYDLLHLDGADLAIVRADAIEHVRRAGGHGGVRRLVRSVARLDDERIVVVARAGFADVAALDGLPVAFGRPGSGEHVTGTLLFDALGIDVERVVGTGAEALGRVRTGELAAMVHLLGDADPFGRVAAESAPADVRVLALPRGNSRLAALYRPATLDATDLPGLVAAEEFVPTWSVDVSLVAYAWAPGHAHASRVERFVEALVDRAEELKDDASEPEWRRLELAPDTPNLEGSPLVSRALERRAATLRRLREEERSAERIPETLTRVPEVRGVRDGRSVDELDDEADAQGEPFEALESLLAPSSADPTTVPTAPAPPAEDDERPADPDVRDPVQPQNSTTSR